LAIPSAWDVYAGCVSKLIYPIDKSRLAPVRLLHFLARGQHRWNRTDDRSGQPDDLDLATGPVWTKAVLNESGSI